VTSLEKVLETAMKIAAEITQIAPSSATLTKALLWRGMP